MNKREERFVQAVKSYYKEHGRHSLPWRLTTDPYKIAVSEVMLQQTQVDRVIPKYKAFLKSFPAVKVLAKASLGEVLKMWSGLGYNRRAKFLQNMAKTIVAEHKGKFPAQIRDLQKLPGIGPYTAGAIAAFAFNMPVAFIETNIRTVYLHHFFKNKAAVADADILKIIAKTVDPKKPREWYWALMDYGSYLKQTGNKIHRKSKHYSKQSKFDGSRRQTRGAIMRALLKKPMTTAALAKTIKKNDTRSVLDDLVREGFIIKKQKEYSIIAS